MQRAGVNVGGISSQQAPISIWGGLVDGIIRDYSSGRETFLFEATRLVSSCIVHFAQVPSISCLAFGLSLSFPVPFLVHLGSGSSGPAWSIYPRHAEPAGLDGPGPGEYYSPPSPGGPIFTMGAKPKGR